MFIYLKLLVFYEGDWIGESTKKIDDNYGKTGKRKINWLYKDIVQLTGASRDTARRDTIKLADNNLVIRTYGGISLANSFNK